VFYLPELYITIKKCLDSIKKYYPDYNLITVDDSIGECPFECTYKNENNLGYTATINRGLLLSKGDVIIICNDDVEIKEGDLDRFSTLQERGIFSPADSASGNLDSFGCIWGMTRETFKKLWYLDETFKHFYSDREYYKRAKKMGIPIIKWRDIVVKHHESATYNLLDKESLLEEDRRKYGNGRSKNS